MIYSSFSQQQNAYLNSQVVITTDIMQSLSGVSLTVLNSIIIMLHDCSIKGHRWAAWGHVRLAKLAGLSRKSFIRGQQELIAAGIIFINSGKRFWCTNTYALHASFFREDNAWLFTFCPALKQLAGAKVTLLYEYLIKNIKTLVTNVQIRSRKSWVKVGCGKVGNILSSIVNGVAKNVQERTIGYIQALGIPKKGSSDSFVHSSSGERPSHRYSGERSMNTTKTIPIANSDFLRSDPDAQLRYTPQKPPAKRLDCKPFQAKNMTIRSEVETMQLQRDIISNPGFDQQMETMARLMGKEWADKLINRVLENAKYKLE